MGGGGGVQPLRWEHQPIILQNFCQKTARKLKKLDLKLDAPIQSEQRLSSVHKNRSDNFVQNTKLLLMGDPGHSTRKDQKPNRRKNEPV